MRFDRTIRFRRDNRAAMRRLNSEAIAEELHAAEEEYQEMLVEDARREAEEAEFAARYVYDCEAKFKGRHYVDNYDTFTDDFEVYDCYKCQDGGWNYSTDSSCTCDRSIPRPEEDYGYPSGDWRNRSAAVWMRRK